MFSRRTPSDFTENALTKALRARSEPYLDLTATNPTAVGLSPSDDEIRAALDRPGIGRYAPDPRGLRSAREAVAAEYAGRGVEIDPERIFLTSSTSEAYAFLFKLLCDPGDRVLVPEPSYPLFDHLTDLEGIRRGTYRLLQSGAEWRIDVSGIAEGLRAGARAVLLVHPNNPTGSFVKKEEWSAIGRGLERSEHAVVSDEVFLDYPLRDSPAERLGVAASDPGILTFSLSGLSKSCVLPQMKIAWIVAGGPAELVERACERLELVADTYLSVSTPAALALPELLRIGRSARSRVRDRLLENLAAATELLPAAAPEGGWSLPVELASGADEEKIVLDLLERRAVLASPGYFFEFESPHLVVSLLPPPAEFREGVKRIADLL